VAESEPEPEPVASRKELPPLGTTADDGSQEVVVDLQDLGVPDEEPEPEPEREPVPEPDPVAVADPEPVADQPELEPIMAGSVPAKSGLMGAVRSAFTRGNRNHAHVYAEAPGGIGIVRKICAECGFVSISTED